MATHKTEIIAKAGQQDFLIIRQFDATVEDVFLAFTNPAYLKQWFMPVEMAFTIDKMECKTGGSFENHHSHQNGMKFGFRGVYHEVSEPDLIIRTSEFTGLAQRMMPVLETTTFERTENGNTKVIIHTLCASAEFRDAMIENGMENHLKLSYALLDNVLKNL